MLKILHRSAIRNAKPQIIDRKACLRWYSAATADTTTERYRSYPANKSQPDDHVLRQIFDSPRFWQDFSQQSESSSRVIQKGLLRNAYLTEPSGFLRFAQDIQRQCRKIVERVLEAQSTSEYRELPRLLDLLSDSLCRVLDVSDFVSATHPDPQYQDAARQAYASLWEYMNVLNTTPDLNFQLRKAISDPSVKKLWNEEETIVAQILLKDFSNSAIHLPYDHRQTFVRHCNDVKKFGFDFLENMSPTKSHINFEMGQLTGLEPRLIAKYRTRRGWVAMPTVGEDAYIALCSVHNEDVRRQLYIAGRQAPIRQVDKLEALLSTRSKIAGLSGFSSFAEMSLSDKMAQSPEAVNSFLGALSTDNNACVRQELRKLPTKNDHEGIEPWNLHYYRNLSDCKVRSKLRKPDFMAAYFSLGVVMQGLSRLFSRLYGIRLMPCPTAAGEVWTPDVRRLDVMHETEGHVAVLYCDLFARPGKSPNPAHFTLRCSRRIRATESADGLSTTNDDGMATARSPSTGDLCQLPTIALVCDFPSLAASNSPSLLTLRDVQTLYHEMGHAIHSILGRTALQVVSGTRCPTDFAELPSVLMESFASDPSVLSLYARHWETDDPLPYSIVAEALQSQKRWQGQQTETQILYSLVDQAYHSSLPHGTISSTDVFFDIYDRYSSIKEPRGTTPQAFFGHLVEYGGTYYSYLFDRAIAGKVWRNIFRGGREGGAIDREAGEKWKDEVLRWGGARNGWKCVGRVLGDERLLEGGHEAMEEVGKWGVYDP